MLTDLQKRGLSIMKYGYSYMCPLPIEWDLETGSVIHKQTFWRLFWVGLNLSLAGSISIPGPFAMGTHYLRNHPRRDVDSTIVALVMAGCSATGFAVLVSGYMFLYRSYYELGNATFKLIHTFLKRHPPPENGHTLLEKLIIPGPLTAVLTPWAVLLTTIPLNYDPFYFVLEDLHGDYGYGRTLPQIFGGILFRCFTLLGGFETARILGNMGATVCVLFYKARKIMEASLAEGFTSHELLRGYRYATILYAVWEKPFHKLVAIVISAFFWVMILALWIMITKYSEAPLFVYLIISSFGIILTVALFLTLTFVSKLGEAMTFMLRRCRVGLDYDYLSELRPSAERRRIRIMRLEAKAFRRITFRYHPFQVISRKFTLDVMGNMLCRLVDALIIF